MKLITRSMVVQQVTDAHGRRLHVGDRAFDVARGSICVVVDFCPDLGPDSLHVQTSAGEDPSMDYWVRPDKLVRLNQAA